jgi:hypothetical protein
MFAVSIKNVKSGETKDYKIEAPSIEEANAWGNLQATHPKCLKWESFKVSAKLYEEKEEVEEEHEEREDRRGKKHYSKEEWKKLPICVGCGRKVEQYELDKNGGLCRTCGTSVSDNESDEAEAKLLTKKCKGCGWPMSEEGFERFNGTCKRCNDKVKKS